MIDGYNAFNVYYRELAPSTFSLTGDRAEGDDSKHCAYSNIDILFLMSKLTPFKLLYSDWRLIGGCAMPRLSTFDS